jgi:Tfp pilus assembly protein PilO
MSLTGKDLAAAFRKHPIPFSAGLTILALGIAFYFRMDAREVADARLEAVTAQAGKLSANIKYGADLEEQTTRISAVANEISARAVRPTELAQNLQYFYRLEAETGTKLIEIRQGSTPAKPAGGKAYVPVDYTVSIQGEYLQVMTFLRRVELGPRFPRVSGTSMSVAPSGADAGKVSLTINLQLLGRL